MEAKGLVDRIVTLAPVIGTVLAVTYDVGYFWGVDPAFFSMFSEHLVFAAQAIPLAVVMTVAIFSGVALLANYQTGGTGFGSASTRRRRIEVGFFWFFVLGIFLNVFLGNYEAAVFIVITVCLGWILRVAPIDRRRLIPPLFLFMV
jgi:hypothetical protein